MTLQNHGIPSSPNPAECTGQAHVSTVPIGSLISARRIVADAPDRRMVEVTVERPAGRVPLVFRVAEELAPGLSAAFAGRPAPSPELGEPQPTAEVLCGDPSPGYPCVRPADHHGHHRDKFGNHAHRWYSDADGDLWVSADESGERVRLVVIDTQPIWSREGWSGDGDLRTAAEEAYHGLTRLPTAQVPAQHREMPPPAPLAAPAHGLPVVGLNAVTAALDVEAGLAEVLATADDDAPHECPEPPACVFAVVVAPADGGPRLTLDGGVHLSLDAAEAAARDAFPDGIVTFRGGASEVPDESDLVVTSPSGDVVTISVLDVLDHDDPYDGMTNADVMSAAEMYEYDRNAEFALDAADDERNAELAAADDGYDPCDPAGDRE